MSGFVATTVNFSIDKIRYQCSVRCCRRRIQAPRATAWASTQVVPPLRSQEASTFALDGAWRKVMRIKSTSTFVMTGVPFGSCCAGSWASESGAVLAGSLADSLCRSYLSVVGFSIENIEAACILGYVYCKFGYSGVLRWNDR